jgi:hypothetical protein
MVVIFLGNDSDASQEMADSGNSPPGSVGSAGSAGRRKYHKKEFLRSQIKTRGAIVPKFDLKTREGHLTRKQWKENLEDPSYVSTRSSSSITRYSMCICVH